MRLEAIRSWEDSLVRKVSESLNVDIPTARVHIAGWAEDHGADIETLVGLCAKGVGTTRTAKAIVRHCNNLPDSGKGWELNKG